MNLSITNECTRRCEYCFQKSWYLSKSKDDIKEMSLDTIEKIFEWMGEEKHTSIMGGEPLFHSKILDIFDLALKKEKTINVISNISCDYDLLKSILETYSNEKPITSWLINTDYPEHQKDLFLKNFSLFHDNNTFSLSTTLLPDSKKIEESADRINELLDMLDDRSGVRIRISPMAPNHLSNYKIYDYSLDALNFISKIWDKGLCKVGFDCTVNACEINPVVFDALKKPEYKKYISKINTATCRGSGPFDILVDNSIIYCSSCNFIKLNNFMDYECLNDARDAMYSKWEHYWKSTQLSCDYKKCEHFNPAVCMGVCAAKNEVIRRCNINV